MALSSREKRAFKAGMLSCNSASSKRALSMPRKRKIDDAEYIALLKEAAKTLEETLDLKKAAKVLGLKSITFRTYCTDSRSLHNEDRYKILNPAWKIYSAKNKSKSNVENLQKANRKRDDYFEELSSAGFGIEKAKGYTMHLTATCQSKRDVTNEISLLYSTLSKAKDDGASEDEIKIIRRKLTIAKNFFRRMANLR